MINKKTIIANLAVLLTIFFWGISASSNKIALREVPPATLALIRFTIASLIMGLMNRGLNKGVKVSAKDRLPMILGGVIGVTFYFVCENYGLTLISAANATILLATIPVITLLVESLYYKKKISLQQWLGSALSIAGVALVLGNSFSVNRGYQAIIGSLLMMGAALCWVAYSMINKNFEGRYPSLYLTFYQNAWGAACLIPFALMERGSWQPIGLLSWGNILFLALFCSALGFFLYLYGLSYLSASQANVYINLMPFIGVLSAYLILKESLYPLQLLGGVIIIAGIVVVNYQPKGKRNTTLMEQGNA